LELPFGVQLGGGTDINGAVGYCRSIIREPRNTIFVLISDLYEGGVEANPGSTVATRRHEPFDQRQSLKFRVAGL
jgi:hypothetical protein